GLHRTAPRLREEPGPWHGVEPGTLDTPGTRAMHPIRTDRGYEHPEASELTPRHVYEQRRRMLQWMAAGAARTALASWAGRDALAQAPRPNRLPALAAGRSAVPAAVTMEKLTAYDDITTYNNFYEFGTDKSDPARHAGSLKTRPWTVTVEGEVGKPRTYGL